MMSTAMANGKDSRGRAWVSRFWGRKAPPPKELEDSSFESREPQWEAPGSRTQPGSWLLLPLLLLTCGSSRESLQGGPDPRLATAVHRLSSASLGKCPVAPHSTSLKPE